MLILSSRRRILLILTLVGMLMTPCMKMKAGDILQNKYQPMNSPVVGADMAVISASPSAYTGNLSFTNNRSLGFTSRRGGFVVPSPAQAGGYAGVSPLGSSAHGRRIGKSIKPTPATGGYASASGLYSTRAAATTTYDTGAEPGTTPPGITSGPRKIDGWWQDEDGNWHYGDTGGGQGQPDPEDRIPVGTPWIMMLMLAIYGIFRTKRFFATKAILAENKADSCKTCQNNSTPSKTNQMNSKSIIKYFSTLLLLLTVGLGNVWGKTVHFIAPVGSPAQAYIHFWGGNNGSNWNNLPQMNNSGSISIDGTTYNDWTYDIGDNNNCIFMKGNGDNNNKLTNELSVPNDKSYFFEGYWFTNTASISLSTIYIKYTSGVPYVYAWGDNGKNANYPGVALPAVDGMSNWYVFKFLDGTWNNFIVNKNDGDNGKTNDLPIAGYKNGCYTYNGNGGFDSNGDSGTPCKAGTNYTITFDANTGSGTMTNQTISGTESLKANTFTKTGYDFSNWNTSADGSGTSYADKASITPSSNMTLYAQWTAETIHNWMLYWQNNKIGDFTKVNSTTYTIDFELNNENRATLNFRDGSTQYCTGSSNLTSGDHNIYISAGYFEFQGATAGSYTLTLENRGGTWYVSAVTNSSIKTITFNSNGGSGTMPNQNITGTANINKNTFTRSGYTFSGWNTQANGSGTPYTDQASITPAENITLYAQWQEQAQVKLAGSMNGWNGENLSTTDGVVYTISKNITDLSPEPELKIIVGDKWYRIDGDKNVNGSSSVTLIQADGDNIKLNNPTAGTYTFTYNISTKELTITYPGVTYTIHYATAGVSSPNIGIGARDEGGNELSNGAQVAAGTKVTFYSKTTSDNFQVVGWYGDAGCTQLRQDNGDTYTVTINQNTDVWLSFEYATVYYVYLGTTLTLPDAFTYEKAGSYPATYATNLTAGASAAYTDANIISGNQYVANTLGKYLLTAIDKINSAQITNVTVYVYRYYIKHPWGECETSGETYNKSWVWQAMQRQDDTHYIYTGAMGKSGDDNNIRCNIAWDYSYDWDGVYQIDANSEGNIHPGKDDADKDGKWIDGSEAPTGHTDWKNNVSYSGSAECAQTVIDYTYENSSNPSTDGQVSAIDHADNLVTLTFGCNNASYGTVSTSKGANSPIKMVSGTEVTINALAKEGYIFAGWYTDLACTNKFAGADGTSTTITVNSNTSIYAKFIAIPEVYITANWLNNWTPTLMTRTGTTYTFDAGKLNGNEQDLHYQFYFCDASGNLLYNGASTGATIEKGVIEGYNVALNGSADGKNNNFAFRIYSDSEVEITLNLGDDNSPEVTVDAIPDLYLSHKWNSGNEVTETTAMSFSETSTSYVYTQTFFLQANNSNEGKLHKIWFYGHITDPSCKYHNYIYNGDNAEPGSGMKHQGSELYFDLEMPSNVTITVTVDKTTGNTVVSVSAEPMLGDVYIGSGSTAWGWWSPARLMDKTVEGNVYTYTYTGKYDEASSNVAFNFFTKSEWEADKSYLFDGERNNFTYTDVVEENINFRSENPIPANVFLTAILQIDLDNNTKHVELRYVPFYKAIATAGAHGSATASEDLHGTHDPALVEEHHDATFNATPEVGYKFVGWFDNAGMTGTPVSTESTYTREDITADITLYAKFEEVHYYICGTTNWLTGTQWASNQIELTKNSNGTYTYVSGNVPAAASGVYLFKITEGSWDGNLFGADNCTLVNATAAATDNNVTFTPATASVVTVIFTPSVPQIEVIFSKPKPEITLSGETTVDACGTASVTPTITNAPDEYTIVYLIRHNYENQARNEATKYIKTDDSPLEFDVTTGNYYITAELYEGFLVENFDDNMHTWVANAGSVLIEGSPLHEGINQSDRVLTFWGGGTHSDTYTPTAGNVAAAGEYRYVHAKFDPRKNTEAGYPHLEIASGVEIECSSNFTANNVWADAVWAIPADQAIEYIRLIPSSGNDNQCCFDDIILSNDAAARTWSTQNAKMTVTTSNTITINEPDHYIPVNYELHLPTQSEDEKLTYTWSYTGGGSATIVGNVFKATASGMYIVVCTATSACSISANKNIYIYVDNPNVGLGVAPNHRYETENTTEERKEFTLTPTVNVIREQIRDSLILCWVVKDAPADATYSIEQIPSSNNIHFYGDKPGIYTVGYYIKYGTNCETAFYIYDEPTSVSFEIRPSYITLDTRLDPEMGATEYITTGTNIQNGYYTFTVTLPDGNQVVLSSHDWAAYYTYPMVGQYTICVSVVGEGANGEGTYSASSECLTINVGPKRMYLRYNFWSDGTPSNRTAPINVPLSYDDNDGTYYYYQLTATHATVYGMDNYYLPESNYDANANTRGAIVPHHNSGDGDGTWRVIDNPDNVDNNTVCVFHYNPRTGRLWITGAQKLYRVKSYCGSETRTFFSNAISAANEPISFYAETDGTLTWQEFDLNTYSWQDIPATTISAAGLSKNGVFTSTPSALKTTSLSLTEYTGNFYIYCDETSYDRTDIDTKNGQMTHFEKIDVREFYDHYWMAYWPTDIDAYATVGNQINPDLANPKPNYLLKDNSNMRYAYDPSTNYYSRTFLEGSSQPTFLRVYGNNIHKTGTGDALTSMTLSQKFTDGSDWVYTAGVTATATPSAEIVLVAHYNTWDTYLLDQNGTDATIKREILGSATTNKTREFEFFLYYDYKTNRLIAAWDPDGENITETETVDADMIIIRDADSQARPSTFALGDGKTLTAIRQIYFALRMDRDNLLNSDNTYKEGLRSKLFQVCLPYDFKLQDIFGLNNYGTNNTWVMQDYLGELRAQMGWQPFIDSFWGDLNWNYKQSLKAGRGYVVNTNLKYADFIEVEDPNNPGQKIARKHLFFPSAKKVGGWQFTNANGYEATTYAPIACNVAGREKVDANWRVVGLKGWFAAKVASANPADAEYGHREDPTTNVVTNGKRTEWIFEWNGKFDNYTIRDAKTYAMNPTSNYFMQYTGTIDWTAGEYSPIRMALAPRKMMMEQGEEENNSNEIGFTKMRIDLQSEEYDVDPTYVVLSDEATDDYDMNMDVTKPFTSSLPQIYSSAGGYNLAAVAVNDTTSRVALGTSLPDNGEYTISLGSCEGDKIPYLYDATLNLTINLTEDSYLFSGDAGKQTGRFFLIFAKAPTQATDLAGNEAEGTKLTAQIVDGRIVLNGAEKGADVRLYDAAGRLLHSTTLQGNSIDAPAAAGVYLLRTADQTVRVLVR